MAGRPQSERALPVRGATPGPERRRPAPPAPPGITSAPEHTDRTPYVCPGPRAAKQGPGKAHTKPQHLQKPNHHRLPSAHRYPQLQQIVSVLAPYVQQQQQQVELGPQQQEPRQHQEEQQQPSQEEPPGRGAAGEAEPSKSG